MPECKIRAHAYRTLDEIADVLAARDAGTPPRAEGARRVNRGLGGRPPLWTSGAVWFSLAGLVATLVATLDLGGSLLGCRIGRLADPLHPSKNHA